MRSALAISIDIFLTELKRLDDKIVLTEVHLLESRVYRGIRLAVFKLTTGGVMILSAAIDFYSE